ncbi:MAG: YdcH family protein [Erythrobacter sp.]|uniref:YdcH family protein n=1 Tax=Erythrobacter sp. TaxID=1042 RepID=UPI00262C3F1F|nr:YdcH family protein [Erythrobacter sp.]MDJ0978948.1 YdcH family protein [Erythrobacter sp.]
MALSETGSPLATGTASHVHALQSKHAGLDAKLREELARPSPDAATVQYLKKRKLALKEEIARH